MCYIFYIFLPVLNFVDRAICPVYTTLSDSNYSRSQIAHAIEARVSVKSDRDFNSDLRVSSNRANVASHAIPSDAACDQPVMQSCRIETLIYLQNLQLHEASVIDGISDFRCSLLLEPASLCPEHLDLLVLPPLQPALESCGGGGGDAIRIVGCPSDGGGRGTVGRQHGRSHHDGSEAVGRSSRNRRRESDGDSGGLWNKSRWSS